MLLLILIIYWTNSNNCFFIFLVNLDDIIENIKTICKDQQIPVVFAFRRRELAYFLYKKASISCIGILDYDGARDVFAQVIEALKNAHEMYESLLLKNWIFKT